MGNDKSIINHFESLYPDTTRFDEVKKILDFVKSGRSSEVIGIPGAGKNNLLGLLSYNKNVRLKHLGENQKWFHFVYMDFSEVKKRNLFDVIKFMLISVAYSLSERGLKTEYEIVNKFLKEAISFQDELILFQALKKSVDYLAIEKELTIVFLFDRFEEYIPNLTQEFFSNLKILRNRAKYRFSAVFASIRPIEDILDASIFSEFHEFIVNNIVYIKIYDAVGLEFRFSYLEKVTGKKTSDKIKEEIIKITGGHVKLSRISYEAVLSDDAKIKNLEKSYQNLIDVLINKPVIKGALLDIWNNLLPQEQIFLQKIAKQGLTKFPVIAKEVKQSQNEEIASSSGQKETPHNDKEKNLFLQNVGLLKNGKITIPLFETFIKDIPLEKAYKISFDAERNEILKGEETITELLSPSEFRLLRFLILNAERVVEKDEIIKAVWKDSKTQEGVTDQALDQIIYRLRKKIENDPNNPTHLLTVKGRGFKFMH